MDTSFKELFLIAKENIATIFKITITTSVIGVIYALLATPVYKSELFMISTDEKSDGILGGGIQGLASQFGLGGNLDMSNSSDIYNKRVAIKILSSREFTLDFLYKKNYMGFLYPEKWNPEKAIWKKEVDIPNHEAIMKTMNETRTIFEDLKSGVIQYSLESPYPEFATDFLNSSVKEINLKVREMSQEDGKKKIAYLEQEINKTNLIQAQAVLTALLKDEKQNLMIANTRDDFVFKVIDKAIVPKQKFKPSRRVIAISSFFFGLLISISYIIFINTRINSAQENG